MPTQFAFLIDENLSPALVVHARTRGFRAVHLNDVNLNGADDKYVARYAVNNGMVLITNNMNDFERMYRARKLHPGLVFMKCDVDEIFTPVNQVTLLDIVLNDLLEKDLVQEALRITLLADNGEEIVWEITRHELPRHA